MQLAKRVELLCVVPHFYDTLTWLFGGKNTFCLSQTLFVTGTVWCCVRERECPSKSNIHEVQRVAPSPTVQPLGTTHQGQVNWYST